VGGNPARVWSRAQCVGALSGNRPPQYYHLAQVRRNGDETQVCVPVYVSILARREWNNQLVPSPARGVCIPKTARTDMHTHTHKHRDGDATPVYLSIWISVDTHTHSRYRPTHSFVHSLFSRSRLHTHTHTNTEKRKPGKKHLSIYLYTQVSAYTHTHKQTHTRKHARARAHTHTHLHTHTCIHTQKRKPGKKHLGPRGRHLTPRGPILVQVRLHGGNARERRGRAPNFRQMDAVGARG
jgi:hypothetical protein